MPNNGASAPMLANAMQVEDRLVRSIGHKLDDAMVIIK